MRLSVVVRVEQNDEKIKGLGYIEGNTQHMLVFCGLRGAVAYALSVKAAAEFGAVGGAMLTATTFLVLVTVILQGAFMQPVMQCLGFGSGRWREGV